MSTGKKIKAAVASIILINSLVASIPEASASLTVQPVFSTIPAFSNDFPVSSTLRPAPASSSSLTASAAASLWTCYDSASTPEIVGRSVLGPASQTCFGTGWAPQEIRVTVQKYLGLGYWNNLAIYDSGSVLVDTINGIAPYNCSGLGTQTYRTVLDAYAAGGTAHQASQSAVYLRATC